MDVTVIVATYGNDPHYQNLADKRAVPSARSQAPVIRSHAETLAKARNAGASGVDTEWLIFLDADDELDVGYVAAMGYATADLRAPAVRYCFGGEPDPPIVFEDRNIEHLNPCVIGTAVRKAMFDHVGGFLNEPVYEDWSLWLRCVRAGASLEHVRDAHYIAHHNPNGRNVQTDEVRRRAYRQIRRRYG